MKPDEVRIEWIPGSAMLAMPGSNRQGPPMDGVSRMTNQGAPGCSLGDRLVVLGEAVRLLEAKHSSVLYGACRDQFYRLVERQTELLLHTVSSWTRTMDTVGRLNQRAPDCFVIRAKEGGHG